MRIFPDKLSVVLDIETTELAVVETLFPEIVEIGACLVDSELTIHEEFTSLVQPIGLEHFTDFSESFTGITPAQLADAPKWVEIWPVFARFTHYRGCRLISFGMGFDYGVLRQSYHQIRVKWPHAYPVIDALSMVYAIAAEYGLRIPGWGLAACCKRFGVPLEDKHRALGGARTVVQVLQAATQLTGG